VNGRENDQNGTEFQASRLHCSSVWLVTRRWIYSLREILYQWNGGGRVGWKGMWMNW